MYCNSPDPHLTKMYVGMVYVRLMKEDKGKMGEFG